MPPLDVRILDHLEAALEPLAAVLDRSTHGVLTRRGGTRRHAEAYRARLVLARQPHGYARGSRAPSLGQVENDRTRRRVPSGVGHRDANLADGAGAGGNDGDLGRHGNGEPGHDLQVHPLLAREQVVDVAVADGPLHRQAHPPRQLDLDQSTERSRAERQSERHVRIQDVAVRAFDMAPVDVGRPRVGGNPHLLIADVHAARADRPALARGLAVEAEEADITDGHPRSAAAGAVIRRPHGHLHRLAGRHDAVVRERVDVQREVEQDGPLKLALLGGQPVIDLPPGVFGQAESGEASTQVAHCFQTGDQRLAPSRVQDRPAVTDPVESSPPLLEAPQRVGCGSFNALQRQDELVRRVIAREARQPCDRGVHTVEQGGLVRRRVPCDGRLGEAVAPAGRAGRQGDELPHALALVHAAREAADLRPGRAEQRVVATEIDRGHVRVRRRREAESRRADAHAEGKSDAEVELPRLPGRQSLGDLLREAIRIRGRVPCFVRQHRRRLVMLAAAAPLRRHGGDHIGPDGADHPDEVAQDLLPAPPLEGLLDAERVPEVDGARKVLLGAVQAVRGVQLLGPQHGQGVEKLGADLVLAPVAACCREQHGTVAFPLRQTRQQRVVLVVGMGHDRQEDARAVQRAQRHPELRPALPGYERLGPDRGPEDAGEDQERYGKCSESIRVHGASSIAGSRDNEPVPAGPHAVAERAPERQGPTRDRAGIGAPSRTAGASRSSTAR